MEGQAEEHEAMVWCGAVLRVPEAVINSSFADVSLGVGFAGKAGLPVGDVAATEDKGGIVLVKGEAEVGATIRTPYVEK